MKRCRLAFSCDTIVLKEKKYEMILLLETLNAQNYSCALLRSNFICHGAVDLVDSFAGRSRRASHTCPSSAHHGSTCLYYCHDNETSKCVWQHVAGISPTRAQVTSPAAREGRRALLGEGAAAPPRPGAGRHDSARPAGDDHHDALGCDSPAGGT